MVISVVVSGLATKLIFARGQKKDMTTEKKVELKRKKREKLTERKSNNVTAGSSNIY